PHRTVGSKFVDDHAHRDAGLAAFAIRNVGYVLAAPETGRQQTVDQLSRLVVCQVREEFSFEPAGQIGTGLRGRDVELWELLLLLRHSDAILGRPGGDDKGMRRSGSRDRKF